MIQIVVTKMRCAHITFHIVRRILDGRNIRNVHLLWHNHQTACMLPRCAFRPFHGVLQGADTRSGKMLLFFRHIRLLQVFPNKPIGCFFLNTGNRSGTKHFSFSKKLFGIFMNGGHIYTGKIQVDIRFFIPVKTQEHFKRNRMSVAIHRGIAVRTFFRRQVKSGLYRSIFYKFTVLTMRTNIVRH